MSVSVSTGSVTGLTATIVVERPVFRLELALTVPRGTITAVVGPNGSGKSTTLRALAGLLRPTRGSVILDGRVLDDTAADIHTPPAQRGAGVVFQDYLLFPHLTAVENVAFGLVAHGTARAVALASARGWLDRFGLADFAGIRPAELSGGQAQRVAIARALALEPPLLLLDEPMAALDASTRIEVRTELAQQLRAFGGATVLVTHDPSDALVLADELLVLENGHVAQSGTPQAVSDAPVNAYVAGLFHATGGQIA